jgi:hypothetical protein
VRGQLASNLESIPVIGALPPRQMAAKLRRMGDSGTADEIIARSRARGEKAQLLGFGPPPAWKHTNYQFGYVPLLPEGSTKPMPIQFGGAVAADQGLKNSRINVHLDRLRAYQYPGGGEHSVLFTFKARNEVPEASEPVSFSQTYNIAEGEAAAVIGIPVFIGLNVGPLGAGFQVETVNVRNAADQSFLKVLDSPPFKSGLNLLTTVQPVLKPFSDITLGVARMFAERNNNAKVHDVSLGLDFTPAAFGVRLAQGNYIVVQVPNANSIQWNDWEYAPNSGTFVHKSDSTVTLPYNYFVFRVTRFEG